MKITGVTATEIFDSRGVPAILCELTLSGGRIIKASVSSDSCDGSRESSELRDGGSRLGGLGVLKAIHAIEQTIAPALIGKSPDSAEIDELLRSMDGVGGKHVLGTNSTLAVSIAVCKAQAQAHQLELFNLVAELYETESVSIPFPLLNILSGGAHAINGLPIQEILLIPIGAQNFRSSLEAGTDVFREVRTILKKQGKSFAVSDEGGFVSSFKDEKEPFDLIAQALQATKNEDLFSIGINVAANQLYDHKTGLYAWDGKQKSSEELFEFYQMLLENYGLYSIEDGYAEADLNAWKILYLELGEKIQIVGGDIFGSKIDSFARGIREQIVNAAIIKPIQIGTVSETIQAIAYCSQNNLNPLISHCAGETNDSFIADLAVGTSSGQIKAGGCSRGERLAKYNRLLEIEDLLTMASLDFS